MLPECDVVEFFEAGVQDPGSKEVAASLHTKPGADDRRRSGTTMAKSRGHRLSCPKEKTYGYLFYELCGRQQRAFSIQTCIL